MCRIVDIYDYDDIKLFMDEFFVILCKNLPNSAKTIKIFVREAGEFSPTQVPICIFPYESSDLLM